MGAFSLLALAIPAGVTLPAAFLIDHGRFAALGAQVAKLDLVRRACPGGGFIFGVQVHFAVGGRSRGRGFVLGPQGLGDHALGPPLQVFVQDLGHAVGQGAHPVGAEAQRAPAADAQSWR